MSRLRLIQEHLNRWMLAYVSLAIVFGLAVGNAASGDPGEACKQDERAALARHLDA